MKNKDKKKLKCAKSYQKNKDKILSQYKEYRKENKDSIRETQRKYIKENIEKIRTNVNRYERERRVNDPVFKLKGILRRKIREAIFCNGFTKKNHTTEILGCSFEEFKLYLESKFEPWMNWDNYGNWNGIPTEPNTAWDIDHIIPLNSGKTEEDMLKLSHYTNLQPLCSHRNRYVKKHKVKNENGEYV